MDYDGLIEKINNIRKNKTYLTNAFFTMTQLNQLLEKDGTLIFESKELIVITEEQKDLIRTYFYAGNNVAIENIQYLVSNFKKPVIVDIIGKDPKAKNLAQILINNGFKEYSVFVRMISDNPKIPKLSGNSVIEYATKGDVDDIIKLLYSEFDPLFSHIPPLQDIICAIEKAEINIVRNRDEIAGLAFFEVISPHNVCLRYFIVDKKFRNQGIGNDLLAHAFNYHGDRVKYMLWVGTYNSAMKKYEHLNFRQDGVIDYILKLRGE